MRKLINSTYITLDGVIDNPMWTFPYFDEEAAALAGEQTAAADALLMGRATYEGFAASPADLDDLDRVTARLVAALGRDRFDELVAEGNELSPGEARALL